MSYSIYKGGSICKVDMVNLCQFPWKLKFIVKWKVHNESKMLKLKVISIRVWNQQQSENQFLLQKLNPFRREASRTSARPDKRGKPRHFQPRSDPTSSPHLLLCDSSNTLGVEPRACPKQTAIKVTKDQTNSGCCGRSPPGLNTLGGQNYEFVSHAENMFHFYFYKK